jgi:hypothetical protein
MSPDTSAASSPQAVAAASAIPFLRRDPHDADASGAGGALVAVLLLAAAGAWLAHRAGWLRRGGGATRLRRLLAPTSAAGLRVLGSTRLTPKASAHVLQWEGRRVLVVCTDHAATVVARDEAGDVRADAAAGGAS